MNESPSLSVAPPQRTPASGKGPIPNRGQMKVKIWTQLNLFVCVLLFVFMFFLSFFPSETDMFFLAISMVGTDFSMICQLFPHRARSEIKVSDKSGLCGLK